MKKETAVEWLVNELENHHIKIDIKNTVAYQQAKEMEKQQLEKELNRFFLYFRENGERLLGASVEQLVKSYLNSR
jgi:hypothetical protein